MQCSDTNRKSNAKVFYFYDPSLPDFTTRGTRQQDQEDPGCHEGRLSYDSYTFRQQIPSFAFPMTPTPSDSKYRLLPPISQQACRKACEAIDHGMGQGYSLQDWYVWYLTEELTDEVMDNLKSAWFPDSDVCRR